MPTRIFHALLASLVLSLALLVGCGSGLGPTDTPVAGGFSSTESPTLAARSPATLEVAHAPGILDGLATIRVDQLPPEARETLALIAQGGPFPYRQDGVVFQNREGYLPPRPDGYYHEYTVKTPGSPDRGARRIITGSQGELYYTDDHYATFKRIIQ